MQVERDLERVLDATHAAVLRAGFADLPDLIRQTEACLAVLGPAAERLPRLRQKAERNARCLQAAGRGLRAARQRLADLQAAAQGYTTYDGQGRRSDLGAATSLTQRL